MPNFIGLHTCDRYSSGNVGDQLITESAIKIIKNIHGESSYDFHFRREDFTSRLEYLNSHDAVVCFCFPFTEKDTRPRKFRIVEDLTDVEVPIIPISAQHKFFPGTQKELKSRQLSQSTKKFIDNISINCPNEEIPVRTDWVGDVLENNGYHSVLVGDPAWYDPDLIGKDFHKPNSIDQLVFTTPHRAFYIDQSKKLLKRLTEKFPDARKIVAIHSAPTDVDRQINRTARNMGWKIKYMSHNTDNLRIYKKSDLHVGYKKHAHLAHLRWRRPSVVLAEDSRAQGLNKTFHTAGFPAFKTHDRGRKILRRIHRSKLGGAAELVSENLGYNFSHEKIVASPANEVIDDTLKFISTQMENEWESYNEIKEIIDATYEKNMKPFVKNALKPHF